MAAPKRRNDGCRPLAVWTVLPKAGLLVAIALTVPFGMGAEQTDPKEQRDYSDGPLTGDEFRAPVPGFVKTAGQKAETQTTLVYKLEYRLYRSGRRSVASLKSIDVRAMFIPSRSWNREPRNARLLDHEQGHFDITHIAALRVRLRFATSKRISGSGLDDEQAIQDLQQQVDRSFRLFAEEDKIRAAHVEYDEITRHGAESGPQEEQRRRQKDEIAKLTERLKDNALQD